MTTVVKAKDPASFLRLVPVMAGFTPRQSVALVPFRRGRSAAVLRMDIPGEQLVDRLDGVADFAAAAMAMIDRVPGADGVAIIIYTDDHPTETSEGVVLPHESLAECLQDAADDQELRIVEALCVTPAGWADYLDDAPRLRVVPDAATDAELGLAPAPGPPAPAPRRGRRAAGRSAHDQHSGVELPHADLAQKERVGRALLQLEAVTERVRHGLHAPAADEHPQAIAMLDELDDLALFFESVVARSAEEPTPFQLAALIWCLNRPILRDAALVQWARDLGTGILALEAQYASAEEGAPPSRDIAETFLGEGRRPDPERLLRALDRVRRAAASAPRASRAAVLTSAAWLSWALGRSTHADHLLAMAREIHPELTLIDVLQDVLDRIGLPAWAFAAAELR